MKVEPAILNFKMHKKLNKNDNIFLRNALLVL